MILGVLVSVLFAPVEIRPPLYGYKAGETVFDGRVSVGGPEQKTGVKGDGVALYVVQVDGVANTAGGRAVDGLWTFADPHWTFGLPTKNARIQALVGADPRYQELVFWRPDVGDAYPAYDTNHHYAFLWRPSPGAEIAFVSPAMKWTNPAEDVLSGTYLVKVSNAVPDRGDAPSIDLEAVDCRAFLDEPGDVPIQPSRKEPSAYWIGRMAREEKPLKGVAADGVSTIFLRSIYDAGGTARFTLESTVVDGGGLHPLPSDVFVRDGAPAVEAMLRPLADKRFVALALYRPPRTLGAAKSVSLTFRVHVELKGGAPVEDRTCRIDLVRPPVVLVHGTYDNPKFCWDDVHDPADDAPTSMAEMLRKEGFDVHCMDWESTNGKTNPSSFRHNEQAVWERREGLQDALNSTRAKRIAVAQADLVCHSQGGVIARVYARGYPLTTRLDAAHAHFHDPVACAKEGCWYHRAVNFSRGDIHRLITVSSTHRGSDVCRLMRALEDYETTHPGDDALAATKIALLDWFLYYVDTQVAGITTDGYRNQTPGSPELMAIGPTPVPAHAIACVATDEDMKKVRVDTEYLTRGMGNYYGKLYKVWKYTPDAPKQWALERIGKPADPATNTPSDGERYAHEAARWDNEKLQLSDSGREWQRDKVINLIREIVFAHDENDCTVAKFSSWGGLTEPYISCMEHVLHGWAPRYRNVQARVRELLTNGGDLFAADGFPDSYATERKTPGLWVLEAEPEDGASVDGGLVPTGPGSGMEAEGAGLGTGGGGGAAGAPRRVAPRDEKRSSGPMDLSPGAMDLPDWEMPFAADGARAMVEDDRLVLDATAAAETGPRTFCAKTLDGDFDVVFDYRLVTWSPGPRSSPSLDLYVSGTTSIGADSIQISRTDMEGARLVFVAPGGDPKPAPTEKAGKFRLRRTGNVWSVFQWSGTTWESLANFERALPASVHVGFGLLKNGDAAVRASVRPTPTPK